MSEQKIEAEATLVPEVMPAHHGLGPSNYSNWNLCPCWDGSETEGDYAARGSYSHLVVQSVLQDNPAVLAEGAKPETIENDDIDAGMWGAEAILALAAGQPVHSEERVTFAPEMEDAFPLMKGVFGTVDAWFVDETGCPHICDFKTFDRGEKDHTPQMSGYALLLCSRHPEYADRQIFLHVIAGGTRRVVTYSTDFPTCAALVGRIITSRLSADRQPCPCDACKTCANIGTCTAVDGAVSLVENKPVWSRMEMADQMVVVEALSKMLEKFKGDFKKKIEEDGEISSSTTGVKWVKHVKNPTRECVDATGLAAKLEEKGVPLDYFLGKVCKVSMKGCTDALMKSNKGMKKSEAEEVAAFYFGIPAGKKGSIEYRRVG